MMDSQHIRYITAQVQNAENRDCPFLVKRCSQNCLAFIPPISYTAAENSPYGHIGQIKQYPAKCRRLEEHR